MTNEEYFKQVSENFDLTEEFRARIATAQMFIEGLGMNKATVLKELNLTEEVYEKNKEMPKS